MPVSDEDTTMNAGDFAETRILEGVSPSARSALAAASERLEVASGAVIFQAGDTADALYVVLRGAVEVGIATESGERFRLDTVVSGEWLGEIGVLTGRPRAATAVALEASELARVPASALERLFAEDAEARDRMWHVASRRVPSHHVRVNPIFAGMNPASLQGLDGGANWVRLRGGELLFRQGDVADALFVVIRGNLEVLMEEAGGERLLQVAGRGDCLGEMGLLMGDARTATVRAIRDCELVRIPHGVFNELVLRQPQLGMNLAQELAAKLKHANLAPRRQRDLRAIAIIPAGASPLPEEFVPRLRAALSAVESGVCAIGFREVEAHFGHGPAETRLDDPSEFSLGNWLSEQEAMHRLVLYECDARLPSWNLRVLRQVDLILIVGLATDAPSRGPLAEAIAAGADVTRQRRELVLLHAGEAPPRGTEAWLQSESVSRHHHVRLTRAEDFGRLARTICGRALGVALSGGGARGFSHIGAIQALRDRGLEIDLVGGTSMGSVIAAQVAMGWDTATMIERNRKAFVECAVVGDMTFPYASIMKGASTVRLLQDLYGEIQIEDLWLPYFCVSTNLSRAEVVVHERGPLWLWVRASSSVPGIGPPVPWNGDLLVDGGLLNNLPADLMRARCPGTVVACDASPAVELTTDVPTRAVMSGWPPVWRLLNPWARRERFPNMLEILMRTVSMSSEHSSAGVRAAADLHLHPPVEPIAALDWAAIDRAVEIGYRFALEHIEAWQRAADGTRPSPGLVS